MTTREPISIENGRVEIHTPENRVWLTRRGEQHPLHTQKRHTP